ncbi:unnamed protein product [Pleuronectes platessa]|uniref:Uncharacterized protein n=1 Tax=Pleuronectes platessa TaxID=8262 RepID=A0A9N7U1U6_PLEPL|nr:unnamed protein product [Pleuronectes platessa]
MNNAAGDGPGQTSPRQRDNVQSIQARGGDWVLFNTGFCDSPIHTQQYGVQTLQRKTGIELPDLLGKGRPALPPELQPPSAPMSRVGSINQPVGLCSAGTTISRSQRSFWLSASSALIAHIRLKNGKETTLPYHCRGGEPAYFDVFISYVYDSSSSSEICVFFQFHVRHVLETSSIALCVFSRCFTRQLEGQGTLGKQGCSRSGNNTTLNTSQEVRLYQPISC